MRWLRLGEVTGDQRNPGVGLGRGAHKRDCEIAEIGKKTSGRWREGSISRRKNA